MVYQQSKMIYSTRQVAGFLGLSVANLSRKLYEGTIPAPMKTPSGDYLWTYDDINAAHWRLYRKIWQPVEDKPSQKKQADASQRTRGTVVGLGEKL